MNFTEEDYQMVLGKSVDMKVAIDNIREMSKKGIYSWTEFGTALDALDKARDDYMDTQHRIILQKYANKTIDT